MHEDPNSSSQERTVWISHPSSLGYLPPLLIALLAAWFAHNHLMSLGELLVSITVGTVPWTERSAYNFILLFPWIGYLPALWCVFQMIALRFVRYELTTQRLRVCTGIIMRHHNEIALHRIRDYVVSRPLMGMLFGYGAIRLITRDPTLPRLDMKYIPEAKEKSEEIRRHALIWKEKMGYREIEAGDVSS